MSRFRPHPAIAGPIAALALAVWLLVGSVVYLTFEQRSTQQRVAKIEKFIDTCLGPKEDTPYCESTYTSLITSLDSDQLRILRQRLATPAQ
jgi:hypothetical protein